ncbi:MAG: glycoside hydrolase family 65 protein [Anaerolineae bacterium]|nr:glycoside hydrolase family 65 protein [Anaerolineae bacterium]
MNEHQKFGKVIYPAEPWRVTEKYFMEKEYKFNETIFSLGNGYLGVRGGFEEGFSGSQMNGTYINGFYEEYPFDYPDFIYANPINDQFMVNVADAKEILIEVDGEPFCVTSGIIEKYSRMLDMQTGCMQRSVRWITSKGKTVDLQFQRMVSFENPHLFAIRCIMSLLQDADLSLYSGVYAGGTVLADQDNTLFSRDKLNLRMQINHISASDQCIEVKQKCKISGLAVACTVHHFFKGFSNNPETVVLEDSAGYMWKGSVQAGKPITLTKYIAYVTSRDAPEEFILNQSKQIAISAAQDGWQNLYDSQCTYLDQYWQSADVEIEGDPALQQGVRFNTFHLLQSVGRDGKTNIAAKGLTGEGYSGHTFWDSEGFAVPFFLYHSPQIAKSLLEYRYFTLEGARTRARQMSHSGGALFPWRTINGDECSSYYPAGTAQYHINADIAIALKKYYMATNDKSFIAEMGAEILFETARIWAQVGWFAPSKGGKYSIPCVTGPDEYTVLVDNNAYTNYMAREHLSFAIDVWHMLEKEFPEVLLKLQAKIELDTNEITLWQKIAENMFLPYASELGIIPQDDGFLAKPDWPFAKTPREEYPLQFHHHMLIIYRHRVCKQADTVLAEFVLNDQFSLDQKKRDFDFYEPITVHDSSLSACIFSIMANEIGYPEKAYEYFIQTARLDLDNCQGNSELGIHMANMAGTWMCVINGFAGLRTTGGSLTFHPKLPKQWKGLAFKLNWQGSVLAVHCTESKTTYTLVSGDVLNFIHFGKQIVLTHGRPVELTNEN